MKDDTELLLLFAADHCYSCGRDRGDVWYLYQLKLQTLPQTVPYGAARWIFSGIPLSHFSSIFLVFLAARPCEEHTIQLKYFFFFISSLQKQRGGPGRVNSVPSSISRSSDFQSEIPGVGWGQCYRQELVFWSVPPASLITPGPLKHLGASCFVPGWWRDCAMEHLWSLPLPQITSGFHPSHSKSEGTVWCWGL